MFSFAVLASNLRAQQPLDLKNLTLEQLSKMQMNERNKTKDMQDYNNLMMQLNKMREQMTAQMSSSLEKTRQEIKEAWDTVKSQIQSRINDQQIKNIKAMAKSKAGNTILKLEEKLRTQQNDLEQMIANATKQLREQAAELSKKIRLNEQQNTTLKAINKAIQDKFK